ncbi:transporter [Streptomyces sp. ID05-04B]|uniref:MFS transporter n=1 Tax=Streptomyces sp. ID05-04B TaxID=3028661 RepID=UPI0029C42B0E|nr:MFS transporter [Streptomyces sp. ID05-04B]MDX5569297.1 transporter [Streptomyces sp. ID05-04B]
MTSTLTAPATAAAATTVSWSSVLRLPHCSRLLTATLTGRLPHGMAPVAILLAARADGLGYSIGAALAALYGAGVAIGQPLLGRLADRTGQTRPLVASTLVSTTFLLVLAVTGTGHLPLAAAVTAAAGLTSPPLEAGLRALWPRIVPTPAHLRAAYALDSGSQELVYVAGPLLATLTATLAHPRIALAVTAAAGLAGALLVAHSAPSKTWRPAGARTPGAPGALRPSGIRLLLLSMTAVGAGLGALNVAALASAEHHRAAWLSGAVPAALSLGALAGSALFSRHAWSAPLSTQLTVFTTAFTLAWLPLQLPAPPPALLLAVTLPGLAFGPLLTTAYCCIDVLAAPGTVTESFGWLVSAFGIGTAAGTALAGAVDGSWLVPAAAAAGALLLAAALRPHLTPAASPRTPAL